MPLSRKIFYSLTLSLSLFLTFWSIKDYRGWLGDVKGGLEDVRGTKIPISITEPPVKVFARVGGYMINLLSGWTSPYAEVALSSQGLARKTTANEIGYFEFNFIPVPENIGEICLIAQDVNQLPTFPTCLAPPPKNMNLEIKDVLLSPSISLASGAIPVGRTTKASGMTFPDSEVEVYLFTETQFSIWSKIVRFSPTIKLPKLLIVQNSGCKTTPVIARLVPIRQQAERELTKSVIARSEATKQSQRSPRGKAPRDDRNKDKPLAMTLFELLTRRVGGNFKLIKSAEALGLPVYKIRSNPNGYFEFSLPANTPSVNRVYATAIFSSSNSELIKDIKGNLEEDKEIFSSSSLPVPEPPITNHQFLQGVTLSTQGDTLLRSPKSNTLSFRALGLLGILGIFLREFFRQAAKFFSGLKNDPLIFILIEILVLLGLIGAIIARKAISSNPPLKSSNYPLRDSLKDIKG